MAFSENLSFTYVKNGLVNTRNQALGSRIRDTEAELRFEIYLVLCMHQFSKIPSAKGKKHKYIDLII